MRGDGRVYVINWIIDDGFVGLTLCRERSKKEKKRKEKWVNIEMRMMVMCKV